MASDNGRWRTEEGHTRLKVKASFFYSDNRMMASTNLGWIQTAFDMLMGIFHRVRLKKMSRKTFGSYSTHTRQAR